MLEYLEKNKNEEICNILAAFIEGNVEAIAEFNKENGEFMREESCIPLSTFMVDDKEETFLNLVVDINGGIDKNFFIVIKHKKEPKYFDEFSLAYDFYNECKKVISL